MKNLMRKTIIVIALLVFFGCNNQKSFMLSDSSKFMIITAPKEMMDSKITFSSFNKEGKLVNKEKHKASGAWQSDFIGNHIFVTGSNTMIAYDSIKQETISFESDSSIEYVARKGNQIYFLENQGIKKGDSNYVSSICKVTISDEVKKYSKDQFQCVTYDNFIPYDIYIWGDSIVAIYSDFLTMEQYIFTYDFDLNLLNKEQIKTKGNKILGEKNNSIIMTDFEGYYIYPTNKAMNTPNPSESFSYVLPFQKGYLRNNFNNDGTEVYFETFDENWNIESKKIFSSDHRKVVESVGDSEILSLLEIKDNEYTILFFDVMNNAYIPFEYQVNDNETVIGAYYLK